MKVQVINKSTNELPKYETPQSAGCDLRADLWTINEQLLFNSEIIRENNIIKNITIYPGGRALIPTGLYMALPNGYEGMVRPRSGIALKYGITVLNTPGCIDADYRGEVRVILINHGSEPFVIKQGDRIAQYIISRIEQIEWEEVEELNDTKRGLGGFGSTNVN